MAKQESPKSVRSMFHIFGKFYGKDIRGWTGSSTHWFFERSIFRVPKINTRKLGLGSGGDARGTPDFGPVWVTFLGKLVKKDSPPSTVTERRYDVSDVRPDFDGDGSREVKDAT